jgi:hypothetical protein
MIAGHAQSGIHDNEADGDEDQFLEDDGAVVSRASFALLLGTHAHHGRDHERILNAVDEEH